MNIEIVLLSHYYIINHINKIWGATYALGQNQTGTLVFKNITNDTCS
jgi:hypothetical protein